MTKPTPRPLDRRRFLSVVMGGLSAAILQACGRAPEPGLPTPGALDTPTRSALGGIKQRDPRVTSTVGGQSGPRLTATPQDSTVRMPLIAAQEVSPTPTATATATPSVTPTPRPSPVPSTPVPLGTPFPPGPQSKLGVHLGYQHPELEKLLRTGNLPLVKTLEYDPNLVVFIKEISPSTLVIARYTPLGQLPVGRRDPREVARDFANLLIPIATESRRFANIDAWEAYNEPVANTEQEMVWLATFEAERTRLLAERGIRSVVGNFATGHPPLELWPAFLPAVRAAKETGGYLGLHEYSAPYMWFGSGPFQLEPGKDEGDEGWLTLRYRKAYRQYLRPAGLEVPLLITETGIDGQVQGRPGPVGKGWLDFVNFWRQEGRIGTTPEGYYMEQLAWYDAELQQDPYVLGAAIFGLAGPPTWESFELIGPPVDLLSQYLSVHPRR